MKAKQRVRELGLITYLHDTSILLVAFLSIPTATSSTPTPAPPPPAPAAHRGAPVRRQLDFTDADAGAGAGGDLELDEFVLSAMEDIERGYSEAKRRAPLCVCRRGQCAVRQDEQSGRWMYVCSAQPVSLPAPSKDRFFFRGFCSFGGKMVPETALGGGNSVRGEGTV